MAALPVSERWAKALEWAMYFKQELSIGEVDRLCQ